MVIETKRITLIDDVYAYLCRTEATEIADTFKKEINKYVGIINDICDSDIKKLTDEQFYKIILNFYDISFEEKDYLKYISKKTGEKYDWFTEIYTSMTFEDRASKGHGRTFEYWDQNYQVTFNVAVNEKYDTAGILDEKVFSKDEIKEMVKNKDIVIVSSSSQEIDNFDFEKESYEKFSCVDIDFDFYRLSAESFPIIISMLRKKLKRKKILDDLKTFLLNLQYEIEIILHDDDNPEINKIAKLCNEWFENSNEKKLIYTTKK